MLPRLSALTPVNTRGMWVGTFHGLCNRMLRAHHRDANLPQLFQILDTQDQLSLIKRMYRAHNLDDERYPPQAAAVVHRRRQGGGSAPERRGGRRRAVAPAGRALRAVRRDVPARRRCRFRRAAAAQLRASGRQRGRCASIIAAASRTCSSTSSRIPTPCNTNGCAARRTAHGRVRGRRRRPVDLRVPRRKGRQHAGTSSAISARPSSR